MDLKVFVDELPYHIFDELRKVVVDRHQREAAEFVQVLKYLQGESTLSKAVKEKPIEVIKVLVEKTETSPELCMRVVHKFLALQEKEQQGLVEHPFAINKKDK